MWANTLTADIISQEWLFGGVGGGVEGGVLIPVMMGWPV